MPLKVKPVSIGERDELEPLLRNNPDIIEQGLRVLAHQHPTDSGPLDILAVDSEETLVVIELKNEASEGHLDQGLRYYDWCRQNLAWLASAYGEKMRINLETPPRLLLIAPSFTDTVRRISKYVDVDVQLIEYHAFETESGERGIICTEIDYGQPPEPPAIPSMEKKLERFRDPKIKELFQSVLGELETRGVETKPLHGTWISFWYKGKRFMNMAPRQKFFVAHVLTLGNQWAGLQRIATRKEWDELFHAQITRYLEFLDTSE